MFRLLLVTSVLFACAFCSTLVKHGTQQSIHFVTTATTDYGEETRLLISGVHVMRLQSSSLTSHQLSDGRTLLSLVQGEGGGIVDCEEWESRDKVESFLTQFYAKISHGMMQAALVGSDEFVYLEAGTPEWERMSQLSDIDAARDSCKRWRKKKVVELGRERAWELVESEDELEMSGRVGRSKRVILPGTRWCGNGNRAGDYEELGDHSRADECCRIHDQCPYFIRSMSEDFGLFNYRMHTLSSCECDDGFNQCLHVANTTASRMVGRLYFDVMGTGCFTIELKRICVEKGWFGYCYRESMKYVATYREPLPFNTDEDE